MTRNGTQVMVSRFDPLKEVSFRGNILSSTASQLKIIFEDKFDLDDGLWRVDIGLSTIVFARMRTAISLLNLDPAQQEEDAVPDRQLILQGTHLRDVLLRDFSPTTETVTESSQSSGTIESASCRTLGHQSPELHVHTGAFRDDMRIQSWTKRYVRREPIKIDGDPPLDGLNSTQIRAIAMMLGERISLVQGVGSLAPWQCCISRAS